MALLPKEYKKLSGYPSKTLQEFKKDIARPFIIAINAPSEEGEVGDNYIIPAKYFGGGYDAIVYDIEELDSALSDNDVISIFLARPIEATNQDIEAVSSKNKYFYGFPLYAKSIKIPAGLVYKFYNEVSINDSVTSQGQANFRWLNGAFTKASGNIYYENSDKEKMIEGPVQVMWDNTINYQDANIWNEFQRRYIAATGEGNIGLDTNGHLHANISTDRFNSVKYGEDEITADKSETGTKLNLAVSDNITLSLNKDTKTITIGHTSPKSLTAGNYGEDSDTAAKRSGITNGQLFIKYPAIVVDSRGHITSARTISYELNFSTDDFIGDGSSPEKALRINWSNNPHDASSLKITSSDNSVTIDQKSIIDEETGRSHIEVDIRETLTPLGYLTSYNHSIDPIVLSNGPLSIIRLLSGDGWDTKSLNMTASGYKGSFIINKPSINETDHKVNYPYRLSFNASINLTSSDRIGTDIYGVTLTLLDNNESFNAIEKVVKSWNIDEPFFNISMSSLVIIPEGWWNTHDTYELILQIKLNDSEDRINISGGSAFVNIITEDYGHTTVNNNGGGSECDNKVKVLGADPVPGFLWNKIKSSNESLSMEVIQDTAGGYVLDITASNDFESVVSPAHPFEKLSCDSCINLNTYPQYDSTQGLARGNSYVLPIALPSGNIDGIELFFSKDMNNEGLLKYVNVAFYGNNVNSFVGSHKWGQSGFVYSETSLIELDDQHQIYIKKSTVNKQSGAVFKYKFNWVVYTIQTSSVPVGDSRVVSKNLTPLEVDGLLGDNGDIRRREGVGSIANTNIMKDANTYVDMIPTDVAMNPPTNNLYPYIQFNISKTKIEAIPEPDESNG